MMSESGNEDRLSELNGMENRGFTNDEIKEKNYEQFELETRTDDTLKTLNDSNRSSRQDEDELDLSEADRVTKAVVQGRTWLYRQMVDHKKWVTRLILTALFVVYWVYFGFAVAYDWDKAPGYCDGVKFLFILTVITSFFLIYFQIIKRFFGKFLYKKVLKPLSNVWDKLWNFQWFRWAVYIVLIGSITAFLVVDAKDHYNRLISVSGIAVLILLGFLFSKYPHRIRWRHVFWGLGLQFLLALFVLRWEVGKEVFECLGDKVQTFLNFTNQGSSFVYGYLVTGILTGWTNVTINDTVVIQSIPLPPQQQLFAFQVLSVMFFFSFCVSILFYYGSMQWMVEKMGWLLQVSIGTTACESMNAAGCIFLGQTEAPLMIKPYLPMMTKSEIHAVMTGGFANVAGSTLAAYISFGIDPAHLLSATIMSAPAALGYSKLLLPEIEVSKTTTKDIKLDPPEERNALEAAANGASVAINLVLNIIANLISFIAFIYFMDAVLSWMGSLVGWENITFEWLVGEIFTPFAFLMGVEWADCEEVGRLIGIKTIVNEFVAYSELGKMIENNEISERSATIATYALCGFSNLSSIGIQLGCLGGMVPERKPDIADVAFRALIAGSASCFLTACVAGSLLN
ncbi:hypothetical protein CHUAL_004655 [Chamberlinius hualienensis]